MLALGQIMLVDWIWEMWLSVCSWTSHMEGLHSVSLFLLPLRQRGALLNWERKTWKHIERRAHAHAPLCQEISVWQVKIFTYLTLQLRLFVHVHTHSHVQGLMLFKIKNGTMSIAHAQKKSVSVAKLSPIEVFNYR